MHEREAMRWLQLTYKVPSEPSQKSCRYGGVTKPRCICSAKLCLLLPYSEEVEKHFRQLAHEIIEMGGDASIFSVTALDASDERRILLVIIEAREGEYNTVIKVCSRFLANAQRVVQAQAWNDQVHAEFTEVLEKVHILFRTAKRHDMLGVLTAPKRASAA